MAPWRIGRPFLSHAAGSDSDLRIARYCLRAISAIIARHSRVNENPTVRALFYALPQRENGAGK
jgi:hypothetical protein